MAKAKLYAEIPYEVKLNKEGFHTVITPCPFGKLSIFGTGTAMVGSFTCFLCEHKQGEDITKQIVKCNHPDNFKKGGTK